MAQPCPPDPSRVGAQGLLLSASCAPPPLQRPGSGDCVLAGSQSPLRASRLKRGNGACPACVTGGVPFHPPVDCDRCGQSSPEPWLTPQSLELRSSGVGGRRDLIADGHVELVGNDPAWGRWGKGGPGLTPLPGKRSVPGSAERWKVLVMDRGEAPGPIPCARCLPCGGVRGGEKPQLDEKEPVEQLLPQRDTLQVFSFSAGARSYAVGQSSTPGWSALPAQQWGLWRARTTALALGAGCSGVPWRSGCSDLVC